MNSTLQADQQGADSALAEGEVVVDDDTEDESEANVTFSISSYGADYPVDTLVARLEKGVFFVPSFQRAYVWSMPQASRFIESLLLGLPVPGIFVAKESGTSKHLIIDGQQRLKTLQFYFDKNFQGREFRLNGVDERWRGKTIDDLAFDDRQRLEDSIIHATVFKQEDPDDDRSIYFVFERLNTGGSKLYPQEIRSCVSYGSFIEFLRETNEDHEWRTVFGPQSKRQKDQELILRFLAFLYTKDDYQSPMREFLNKFVRSHRNINGQLACEFREAFRKTISVARQALGDRVFRPFGSLNAAVFDSVMVGLCKRLQRGHVEDLGQVKKAYDSLLGEEGFRAAYMKSTAGPESVRLRFELAQLAFEDVR